MSEAETEYQHPLMATYWKQLNSGFPRVKEVFEDTMAEALAALSREGLSAYLDAASFLGRMGRGDEPILAFLEEWPSVAKALGEEALVPVMQAVHAMHKSPNGKAIAPFIQTLAPVARRLHSLEQLQHYLDIALDLMARTTGSIHGHHTTFPSPGLPEFYRQAPFLFSQLSMAGVRNWVEYGIRNYRNHPERQAEYFALKSADSRAVMQRERHGVLFADVERKLDLYLRGLWQEAAQLVPYSTAFDELRKPMPYYDKLGMRVPDVFDSREGVQGIDRYRAVLAHMVGHRRWTTQIIADNYSPLQRMCVEFFEDCRIETLLCREYPGLKSIFLALHPQPREDACDPETMSCLRHRLTLLSRALLDENHGYRNPAILEFVARFHEIMAPSASERRESSTREIADLALAFSARTRRQSDQFAKVYFDDTVIDYRDDNRHLWQYIEDSDDEDYFDDPDKKQKKEAEVQSLPPRHYPEWDYHSQTYRPDWVSLYEHLHPKGNAAEIDRLLQKNDALAKRLKRILDLLKPQDKVRIRYQEEGSELDLDVAIRSLIDFKGGATPDPRINMSHKTSGRNIAVSLVLDLSESLNEKVAGSEQTILELSQEAVSLLAWAIERLGDPFAISGFYSNTRHDVRFLHIKGYSEGFTDEVKARLAAMEAGWSTRMGAAMRHAAHYLEARPADKKLLLILTDGQPADVDVQDEKLLIEDARRAVRELDQKGIFSYCINLDPKADEYVGEIFGRQYTVVDNIQRLPEKLPELFMALTK
ncbi:von Willebrand factor type A domain-containing protein [Sulfuritortus calidifontis]|uniref:von Willebrand factor type A domain-containing protein n=1 Tax=Sulfuritortus calidifontis TaxID=1914471 RepID=A0A4R3JXZ9_9PROT|nr:VWA domain-containing protein [Sulfuritortus calidifontis]TCS72412.1 von Willebrand factor type A domain-containing protein [Sulfuritortus calidifontis]